MNAIYSPLSTFTGKESTIKCILPEDCGFSTIGGLLDEIFTSATTMSGDLTIMPNSTRSNTNNNKKIKTPVVNLS